MQCIESSACVGKSELELNAVKIIKTSDTMTDSPERSSINMCEAVFFISWAYLVDAMAITVKGKEYAHHDTLNFLIDLLNKAGLDTCTYIFKNKLGNSTFSRIINRTLLLLTLL